MTAARGEIIPTTVCLIAEPADADRAVQLRARAEHLRTVAVGMHDFVAQAYRRRAAELEFEAWLTEVRSGQVAA